MDIMGKVLEVKSLSKSYGKKVALDNVNLEIKKGKIIGLLGPNGSGKTTFMKIVAMLLRPSCGNVLLEGTELNYKNKAEIAYLLDSNALYRWMKVKDAIEFYKDFYEDFQLDKLKELMNFMELEEEMNIKELSKGMQERLMLALTLARKAKIFLLDEPLAAVDIITRDKIIDAIINNFDEESTMLISTHLIKDVERLFDEVICINKGKVVLNKSLDAITEESGKSLEEIYKEVFINA